MVGANLRALRESAGISQSDLAARMTVLGTDWTGSNVSLIEAGKRKLTLTALGDLCRILGVPLVAMFGTEKAEGVTAERLAALGGTESATSSATPDVADDAAAAAVARARLADRVVGRIVARIDWDSLTVEPHDRHACVLDAVWERYDTRDVLQVREQLAYDRVSTWRWDEDQMPEAGVQWWTLDDVAEARSWATRRITERVEQDLTELHGFTPPF